MPPQDSFRLDDHQCRVPAPPTMGQDDPEDPVIALEARSPDRALHGSQLLA